MPLTSSSLFGTAVLASISSPSHSSEARIRALDDLPKRAKSLGSAASQWLFYLARRTAMGYFLNTEIIDNCILLAQEAFNEGNFEVCRAFLESANAAFIVFPSMSEKGFDYITELFSACRESLPAEERKLIKQYGILTTLSNIMSRTAHARASPTQVRGYACVPLLLQILHFAVFLKSSVRFLSPRAEILQVLEAVVSMMMSNPNC